VRTAFSEALIAAMSAAGVSGWKLAERANVEASTIYRLRNGTRNPSRDTVDRLVAALNANDRDAMRLYHAAGLLTPKEWTAATNGTRCVLTL
jgi:transcriptional regulator with XRE-family HTH domain